LIPPERARSFNQLYFLRLATVSVLLLAGIAMVNGVLLLPTYLYLRDLAQDRAIELSTLASELDGTGEQEIRDRVSSLSGDSAYLARLSALPKASAALGALVVMPHPGITLAGFSFLPASAGATMSLSGKASTRDALRRYEQSLRDAPYIDSVDLPISAYAKESDIDFTIMLSGPFLP
ncbi:MAG: hypothetical protein ACSLE1_02930, partial [Sphingobium sp.]